MLGCLLLFGLAASAGIGGAWLVWQGVRDPGPTDRQPPPTASPHPTS
jgi:hypothetical protein